MRSELVLPQALTIYEVQQVAAEWIALVVASPEHLMLDLSQLQELDGAGFQLILSLCNALPTTHCSVQVGSQPNEQSLWLQQQLRAQGLLVEAEVC
ncbi:MAG: STAS domain-containing protein [Rheinheimera sp.]